jgi:hypothetical protein
VKTDEDKRHYRGKNEKIAEMFLETNTNIFEVMSMNNDHTRKEYTHTLI